MGNINRGGGSSKSAKVMKINGEFFKVNTPARVLDIIKDYPNHILLDSNDFLRFNLRANPLDPHHDLNPKTIYLLVELPEFPGPLRRVQSGLNVTPKILDPIMIKRSISDLSILTTRSDECGLAESPAGSTRVKMRLRKAEVQKIVKESGDDQVEIAKKIVKLCLEDPAAKTGGGSGEVEEEEQRFNARAPTCINNDINNSQSISRYSRISRATTCIPYVNYRRKYGKLTP